MLSRYAQSLPGQQNGTRYRVRCSARLPDRQFLACARQDSLAAWAAALLEGFPTLTRLHLNHNSDAAASRVASRAVTPRWAVASCPAARVSHTSARFTRPHRIARQQASRCARRSPSQRCITFGIKLASTSNHCLSLAPLPFFAGT